MRYLHQILLFASMFAVCVTQAQELNDTIVEINQMNNDAPLSKKVTGSIEGKVTDAVTGEAIEFASVACDNLSVYTDSTGYFIISDLPVGRHTLKVNCLGYDPIQLDELMISSAHVTSLQLLMESNSMVLEEVIVRDKSRSVNKLALAGAHKLDITEANRYAGSMDDPGRLASTVAGAATDVSHNGLSVHGMAPHLMQWRLEGVEIPNPNHYADIATLGGGVLSSLSGYVLGNSDFYAGASPAQYVNALSGVFDMRIRNGNDRRYQHAFQVGVLGINLASEGPIGTKGGATYVANYRYSATGLLEDLGAMDAGGSFKYQDLNFKVNVPMRKGGDLSVWGTMFIDKFKDAPDETAEWIYIDDGTISSTDQKMVAGGLNYSIRLGNGRLNTTVAATHSSNEADMEMTHPHQTVYSKYIDADKRQTDIIATANWFTSLTDKWKMRIGATATEKIYELQLKKAPMIGETLIPVTDGDGSTMLVSAYSDNVIRVSENTELGAGVNMMWLSLNDKMTVEPRLSLRWRSSSRLTLAAATGLYSRMENMDVYFTRYCNVDVNKDLGFTKAYHAMLSAEFEAANNFIIGVSPFFHYLYDVPSGICDSYSILNTTDFYINRPLVNTGKGRTYGIDINLERQLSDGWYGKTVVSLFDSRYCGGDGQWHNTRFNRSYIVNLLAGKEWNVGSSRNNILNLNGRMTLQGGERYTPFDTNATAAHPDYEVQYDESKAYSLQHKPMFLVSFSVSYRINRKHVSHIIAADVLNAGGYSEPYGHAYNIANGVIDILKQKTFLPNIYYRLEF